MVQVGEADKRFIRNGTEGQVLIEFRNEQGVRNYAADRRTEGQQDHLNQYAEGQPVFVVRHRGGGPCGCKYAERTKIRKECSASELPWAMLTSTGMNLRCTRA